MSVNNGALPILATDSDAADEYLALCTQSRDEVYAAATDGKGRLRHQGLSEVAAIRTNALDHRDQALNTGDEKILGWNNEKKFVDHSEGAENFFAGQGHRPVDRAYLTASGSATTGPASGGSRVRAASPRSKGTVRIVNGVRTTKGPQTQAQGAAVATSQTLRGPRQTTSRQPTPALTSARQSRRGPMQPVVTSHQRTIPHGLASHASSGGNSGRIPSSRASTRPPFTGTTVEAIGNAAFEDLITAAENGTLGDKFLPLITGDAHETARLRVFISEAAFKSDKPTDSIKQKGWDGIFLAARKYLVEMTFELIKRNDPELTQAHWEKFKRFDFENGLYATAAKALERASDPQNSVGSMREHYENEGQLDVINKALEGNWIVRANVPKVPAVKIQKDLDATLKSISARAQVPTTTPSTATCSDNGETPNDSHVHGQSTTDMSIKVTTTVSQTVEHVIQDMANAPPLDVTTNVTGPFTGAVKPGFIHYYGASRSSGLDKILIGSADVGINILPPGLEASVYLIADDDDTLRRHMANPLALSHALGGLAMVLRGEYTSIHHLENVYAEYLANPQSTQASQGQAENDDEEL